jgi:hypothetical protein
VLAVEARRYPSVERIAMALGRQTEVIEIAVPHDCTDGWVSGGGFQEAYYGRPERFLDRAARLACSAWSFVAASAVERMERDLERDLRSGARDARHGYLRKHAEFQGSLRSIVGRR